MKLTIFSSNQPRHLSLVKKLSTIAEEIFFISEVNTIFPGQVSDFFARSEIMQRYFKNVMDSESKIFGNVGFLPSNVKTLSIKLGDLNKLERLQFNEALESDVYIVFGSSYIKGWLADFYVNVARLIFIWACLLFIGAHRATSGPCMIIILVLWELRSIF